MPFPHAYNVCFASAAPTPCQWARVRSMLAISSPLMPAHPPWIPTRSCVLRLDTASCTTTCLILHYPMPHYGWIAGLTTIRAIAPLAGTTMTHGSGAVGCRPNGQRASIAPPIATPVHCSIGYRSDVFPCPQTLFTSTRLSPRLNGASPCYPPLLRLSRNVTTRCAPAPTCLHAWALIHITPTPYWAHPNPPTCTWPTKQARPQRNGFAWLATAAPTNCSPIGLFGVLPLTTCLPLCAPASLLPCSISPNSIGMSLCTRILFVVCRLFARSPANASLTPACPLA